MPFTFSPLPLQDALLIEPKVFGDARGWFMETYHYKNFLEAGIPNVFVQDNESLSMKGVLRGLHFQTSCTQAKLVRVKHGALYDILVDIRATSPTFGQGYCILLNEQNNLQLFVPKGFAHGFFTIEDNTEFSYKCDDVYAPAYESGIHRSSEHIHWIGDTLSTIIERSMSVSDLILAPKDTLLEPFDRKRHYF